MRTKVLESVMRLDVIALLPKPEVHITYDGLAGLSQRPILRDIYEELQRKGPKELAAFLAAVKQKAATVSVAYSDYVSYGIGGGDAVSEFDWPRTMLLWYEKAKPGTTPDNRDRVPEHLVLRRRLPFVPAQERPEDQNQIERLSLEPVTY